MPARARARQLQNHRISFKISFFQDVFTIVEELTGDCPGVGLPEGFIVEKKYYDLFKNLQKKYCLTDMYITNFKAVKHLQEWKRIQKIIALYNLFWNEHKYKLLNVKKSLKKEMDFDSFIKKLEEITKIAWTTKMLDLFLTIGYKQSGTYDRKINVIRVGIHEDNKLYLPYTIYHELIHFHIINHMKLKLPETEEEILCRAIFKLVFINDLIAQSHWKEFLTQQEQEKINKKAEEFQFL